MYTTAEVSATIRLLRELKQITREAMAAELNLSLSGYSKIERGETDLTLTKLMRIAEVLDVEVSKILNFDPSHVFNINNNHVVQGIGAENVINNDKLETYRDKYITMLEAENARLRRLCGEEI